MEILEYVELPSLQLATLTAHKKRNALKHKASQRSANTKAKQQEFTAQHFGNDDFAFLDEDSPHSEEGHR
jgi:hypothetical protein